VKRGANRVDGVSYAILVGPVKALSFLLKLVVTIALGGAALTGALVALGPASRPLEHAATPIGRLDVTINAPPARSLVLDHNGNIMASFATEDRAPVKLKNVPQVLIDAVLSIEDRKFYEHHGVDWAGTTRALFKNVDAGGISQGGSTITQQLVKNVFSSGRKRDLKTKAREAILAIKLEQQISKSQILEDYLNLVYFGNGAYGVQAAVERYFPNTPLKKVDLAQAALLAGVIQAPGDLDPMKHPGAAARRRSEVLDAMVANHKATAQAAHLAKYVPLPTKVSYAHPAVLDYYTDEVKNVLLNDDPNIPGDPAEVLGPNQQARANAVFRGGLRIYTSYDPALQLEANAAMNKELPKSEFTASLVVIDNADGGVRAIANGRTFAEMQFDPATEGLGRQAGSAFKVFTLAAALSRGYTPNDTVSTSALNWRLNQGSSKDSFYELGGRGDDCGGDTITLTRAISRSDNCAFVRTELSMGPGNFGSDGAKAVIETAKAMGINTSNFQPVVTTTLGTNGVHPLEMAQAYSVLPNDGILRRATIVTKIVDATGKTIFQAPTNGTRVLDSNVARTEIGMLKHVLKDGTAAGTLSGFPRFAAGKTGTTDRNQDAWFVGFTPQLTAAVWMGNPDGEIPMTNVGGITVFGATYPARIWRTFMEAANAPLPDIDFAQPDDTLFNHPRYLTELGRKTYSYVPSYHYNPTPKTTPATSPTVGTEPPQTAAPAPTQNSPPPKRKRHKG
jgi:penicillin-binding protein 1A